MTTLLPDLGDTDQTDHWTAVEIWAYALTTYLIVFGFLAGTLLAACNLVRFIKVSDLS